MQQVFVFGQGIDNSSKSNTFKKYNAVIYCSPFKLPLSFLQQEELAILSLDFQM
ncbi:hypothetical protein SR187_4735 [Streptococcus ruminantium]|uniref:Uncharacterized protein n=1 Tax=Streptococcus ruminantium TaxID=1917441 RepID=A0A2Z5TQ73_9STRE|nr:hypothetical protein SR187_4735 [Streptococcus ruminantium]